VNQPRLHVVEPALDFGKRGELRQNVGKNGELPAERLS